MKLYFSDAQRQLISSQSWDLTEIQTHKCVTVVLVTYKNEEDQRKINALEWSKRYTAIF